MYKKSITYTDYDGETRTETFYFNISRAEFIDMNMNRQGSLQEYLNNILNAKDNQAIYNEFKKLITLSYGVKSQDGKRFIKSKELTDEFIQSEAYSELMMMFFSEDSQAEAEAFVKGIIPTAVDNKQKVPASAIN